MRVEVMNNLKKELPNKKINNVPKRKVAGYARVSTDKDEQFTSYEAQVEYYTNYINTHEGWELTKIYTDIGTSATSTKNRIGFQNMMKDALKGKFSLIVTKSISRFARNTLDSLMAIRKLKDSGVEIFFEKENIWTFDGKGELLITIMSSIAQEESRSISMNVTWGIRQSMKQGKAYVPYKVFLGYEKGANGEMVVNEEQAKIVRRIYAMAMQDISPYNTARTLEKEGVEFSPGVYKWYASTIKSILRNEKYKGDAIRQKTYTSDFLNKVTIKNKGDIPQYYIHSHHLAIIPPDIFDRLQNSLNEKPKDTDYKRSKTYIFSKKLFCPYCNGFYGPVIWHQNTPSEVMIWKCNNKYKIDNEGHKISPSLKESYIENMFLESINQRINDKEALFAQLIKLIKAVVSKEKRVSINQKLKNIKNRKLIVQSFNENMWLTCLEKVVILAKNNQKIVFRE